MDCGYVCCSGNEALPLFAADPSSPPAARPLPSPPVRLCRLNASSGGSNARHYLSTPGSPSMSLIRSKQRVEKTWENLLETRRSCVIPPTEGRRSPIYDVLATTTWSFSSLSSLAFLFFCQGFWWFFFFFLFFASSFKRGRFHFLTPMEWTMETLLFSTGRFVDWHSCKISIY